MLDKFKNKLTRILEELKMSEYEKFLNKYNRYYNTKESRIKRMDILHKQYDPTLKWTLLEINKKYYKTLEEFLNNHTVINLIPDDFNILEDNNDFIIATSVISDNELMHLRYLDYLKITTIENSVIYERR